MTALACALPEVSGVPQSRWSCADLAAVLKRSKAVASVAPSTIWRWLDTERIKPWRFHSWQHVIDPFFRERAIPILDLYENAAALLREGVWVVCVDEKTSMQALERVHPLSAPIPDKPIRVAAHYVRRGVGHLFGALRVGDGKVLGCCRENKRFVDFQAFLQDVLISEAVRRGVSQIRLILDNGSTHAPRQLPAWLEQQRPRWSCDVELYWLPKYASWLDQIEIWFSILQRKVLTPGHFPTLGALEKRIMDFIDYYNHDAKPIQWSYTTQKLIEKFGTD